MKILKSSLKFSDLQVVQALITEEYLKSYKIEKVEMAARGYLIKFRGIIVAMVEVSDIGVEVKLLKNEQAKKFEKILQSKYMDKTADFNAFFIRR